MIESLEKVTSLEGHKSMKAICQLQKPLVYGVGRGETNLANMESTTASLFSGVGRVNLLQALATTIKEGLKCSRIEHISCHGPSRGSLFHVCREEIPDVN